MQASKDHMLQISRLGPQAAFDVLRKSKEKRWTAEGLVLQALPKGLSKTRGNAPYGLCVSCSKKTAKRAHDRNRIKRRLKAIACEVLPDHAIADMDYMLSGRYSTAERDFDLLRKDLLWCLKKLELLKSK